MDEWYWVLLIVLVGIAFGVGYAVAWWAALMKDANSEDRNAE